MLATVPQLQEWLWTSKMEKIYLAGTASRFWYIRTDGISWHATLNDVLVIACPSCQSSNAQDHPCLYVADE